MADNLPKEDEVVRVLGQVQNDLKPKKRPGDIACGSVEVKAQNTNICRTEHCIKKRAEECLVVVNKQVLSPPITEENDKKTVKFAKWWPPHASIPYIHPQKLLTTGSTPGEKHKAAFTMRVLYNPDNPLNRDILYQTYGIQLPGTNVRSQNLVIGPNSLVFVPEGFQNRDLFPFPTPYKEDTRTDLCEKGGKHPRDMRQSNDVTIAPVCSFSRLAQTPPPSIASDNRLLPYTSASQLNSKCVPAVAPIEQHCFSIVEGHVETHAVNFCAFKEYYYLCLDTVLKALWQLELLLRQFAVPYARVCGKRLVALALNSNLQLQARPENLLLALENREEVLEIIRRPGQRYKGEGGQHAAAVHIQAYWKQHHARTVYLYLQRCKWAARIISKFWFMHTQMSLVRKRLQTTRLRQLENYHSRAVWLAANWNHLRTSKRTIIHIPSLGYSKQNRRSLGRFDILQNTQMGRLCDIIDNNVEVIYVCPVWLGEDLENYYSQLLGPCEAVEREEATASSSPCSKRFTILIPEACQHFTNHFMCVSTLLKYSPYTLHHIKNLIQGKQAYIVSGVPHMDDLAVADELEVPILGSAPDVAQLYGTKSGARRIFSSAGVNKPPGCADIYTLHQLHECLAQLMTDHLEVQRWFFKMDGELGGRGMAYCDVCHVSFRPWALQVYHRHGSQLWKKSWAQEQVLVKFQEAVPALLTSHAKPVNTSTTHSSWICFLEHFLRKGGVIEAYPPSDHVTCLTVDLLVEPGGTAHMLSCGDKLHGSDAVQVAGCSMPQSSVCPNVLNSICMRVSKACHEHHILGYLSLDLVTFLEPVTLDQQVWAVGLDLGYSNQLAMTQLMLFMIGGTLDCRTSRLEVSYPQPDNKPIAHNEKVSLKSRFAVMSNRLFHTNLSMINYTVFLQMCKAQGIFLDIKAQQGSLFVLHDTVERNSLGMITISEDLQGALLTFARNLSVIHQEISAPNMQGETNFKDLIKSIEKVLHMTSQNITTTKHNEEEK